MDQQYTLILPIKIHVHHAHHELDRFIQLQLRSLNKFLDIASVYEFLIICRQDEINSIQKILSKYPSPLPIRLIPENQIIKDTLIKGKVIETTSSKHGYYRTWYLQQLLKLGAAKIIKTPLYLILDTDCFLTKSFSYQDLFYEGKILVDQEFWTFRPQWWIDAINIIDEVSLAEIATQQRVMNMTPQILITEVVRELMDYLDHKENNLDWDEYLSQRPFTEFSLYWTFLIKTNRTHLYHLSEAGPFLLGNAIATWHFSWSDKVFRLTRRIKAIFNKRLRQEILEASWKQAQTKPLVEQIVKTQFKNNERFYFSLIQSNIREIPLDLILEQTNKYLN